MQNNKRRCYMKKWSVFLLVFVFSISVWILPAIAVSPNTEVEQLKGEVKKLLKRIEDLEKKQATTDAKTAETEKKVAEAEKKVEKVEKKSLKDRIEFSGEARFRIMVENASADKDFYGVGQPNKELKYRDETSFPLRVRLNAMLKLFLIILIFMHD